ncbi:MAG: imidazole glycerol phosphate synthase subunit HisH, partial [Planctomycetaceae bacterium]|nr:imidazole glycerol phosphate synthase subunit HisH [Planctomycetaceae bacterium]
DGEWEGLGVIPGRVVRFENEPGLKIPHMGWNTLEAQGQPAILEGLSPEAWFYFVHSYHVVPEDESVVAARTTHGQQFVSVIERGNLAATQFHPEKSQRTGQSLLRNFARIEQEYTA